MARELSRPNLNNGMTRYVYVRSEPGLYTTGFYDPSGKWHPDDDFTSKDEAAARVHYLNGGTVSDKTLDRMADKATPDQI